MHLLTAINHFSSCRNGVPPLIFRAMKLTAIFLFAACMTCYATGLGQKVTLNEKNVSLEKVFKEIRKQTGFDFLFSTQELKQASPVTVSVKDISLEEALRICFQGQPFAFIIENNTIIVKKKTESNPSEFVEQPAEADISGRIANKMGEALTGASVIIQRTGKGDIANADGRFKLSKVRPDDVIEVSYTGYKTKLITVGGETTFFITLEIAADELDRVQIQAYGKTNKRIATGNIATVSAEEIERQPVFNPLQALQGRVPGLTVTQTSGYGSAPFKVEIRGRNNINDRFTSEPLYIIDGVPLTVMELANASSYSFGSSGFLQNGMANPANGQSPLFNLNPNDIESIEVLKDADATAIYGSRAANGVILISTKKGKAGKAVFNATINYGITAVTKRWEMLNTQQYVEIRKEAFVNDGIIPDAGNAFDILNWDTTKYFDWQDYAFGQTGKATNAQVGLSGGNSLIKFRIGGGYNRRTDISTVSGADERGSVSLGLNFKNSDSRFNLSLSSNYSFSKSNMVGLPYTSLLLTPPNSPDIFDSTGRLNYEGWQPALYPFSSLFQPYTSTTNFLNTNLTINYEILKGLNLRSSFGFNSSDVGQTFFTPITSQDYRFSPTGTARFGENNVMNWLIEPQVEYNRFIGKGRLNIVAGGTIQSNKTEGLYLDGSGYTSDFLLGTISNAPVKSASELFGEYKYAALFGRINYNWKNKYILNFSGRRDGSSRFGKDHLFGNFGAVGAAWVFSEESFLHAFKFISFGKLRGSYGTTGSDGVGEYQYLTRWSSSGTQPYAGISSLRPTQHANDSYHWPVNKKTEAAIDLGFLKDRISLSVAWYLNRCNDQLVGFPLPAYTGFNIVTANSPALVQNTGWEISLFGKLLSSDALNWTMSFNTAFNRNKLISYPNLERSPYVNQMVVGRSLSIIKLLHYTGVDPQTGLYTFEDKNRDGSINVAADPTVDDRYVIDLTPAFTGGLGSNFVYKGIELSLFFNIVKQKGINAFSTYGANPGAMYNASLYVYNNMWRKPGDVKQFAKATTGYGDASYNNFYNSDAVYTDASFIRLTNLSLGYSLPERLIKAAKLSSIQLKLSAQNLFVITKYKGIDPETQNFGGMPPAKVITAGLNLNF
jgi:TonB-linked SusC/RagA family outer membrane protein